MVTKETITRAYDGKKITWELLSLPDLVPNYAQIQNKVYCNPYFWVITGVEDE